MTCAINVEDDNIIDLINKRGACRPVKTILDKLKIDDNSFAVIFKAVDGTIWGAITLDGDVNECGGTGHKTASSLLKERLYHGEFIN